MTHVSNAEKDNVTVVWHAPDQSDTDIVFRLVYMYDALTYCVIGNNLLPAVYNMNFMIKTAEYCQVITLSLMYVCRLLTLAQGDSG